MFKSARFYAIVSNKSLIIKKEGENSQNIIDFASFIPNVPFYHHFFDEDKAHIKDVRNQIKKMRMKNLTIILPDDAMDIDVDKRIVSEFFMQCGVKNVQIGVHGPFLSLHNKKYISISRTTRTIVLQYIVDTNPIVKKYYDKNCTDMKQIQLDMKSLHIDCQYESIPTYINNINNDMAEFEVVGSLVSLNDLLTNIINSKIGN